MKLGNNFVLLTTRFTGGLTALHLADEVAVWWFGVSAQANNNNYVLFENSSH